MLRTLFRVLPRPHARQLAVLTGWLTAAAILQGVTLGLAGINIATFLDAGSAGMPWLTALLATAIAYGGVQWIAQVTAFRVGRETARALHVGLGEHLAQLPLGWFTSTRQARIIDLATTGVPQLMSYPALLLRPTITAVVTPPAAALTLWVLDWRYGLAVLVATAAGWWCSRLSGRLARSVDARRHAVQVAATNRILEYAGRQPVIRTDQRPGDTDDLSRALDHAAEASRRSAGIVLPGLLLFGVTVNALFAALAGLGVAWIADASLTVGVLVGVLVVAARLAAVGSTGAELAAGLRLQHATLARIVDVLDSRPLPTLQPSDKTAPGDPVVRSGVTVRNIGFSYGSADPAGGIPVLDGVSFTLPDRGLTALVGPSGSGKTTITRLLARFWDPTAGSIEIDGRDLRTLPADQFYAHLATVLQDDYLLDTTIAENIRTARPEATADEIAEVVREAGLEATVAALPGGLDHLVGPGGSHLSGGQRQRICVARALLKRARLTLLDEATSALDPANSEVVLDAARRLATQGHVVVIAHHLDTIIGADQILVLDRGRLVQCGTHAELSRVPGRYRDMLVSRVRFSGSADHRPHHVEWAGDRVETGLGQFGDDRFR
ncbi:ABC transporter ATP-binding protein [Micromonospora sp. HNM0581]|uniref:ABC transporter ATP-binding protein n=1 Tax=Micromonospora sp. HNM0581 TaxID=2716341 RepID=UPI00146C5D06|nr:ABC transporter ATP-binding protein [Micromonospora sp. HNM0581]NLU79236.1 ABC transporter ATP-binding protein [Micromonospora sp. HNM0581]